MREILVPPGLEPRFTAPPGLSFAVFEAADGLAIRWARVSPPAPRATVVILPGFTEFIEAYHETMRDLLARDIAVFAMDWPSQGGSGRPLADGEKVHARSFDGHVAALRRFVETIVRPAIGSGRLTLVGHSLGGHLVTRTLQDAPGIADAAALSAPAYAVGVDSPLPPGPTAFVLDVMNALGFSERWALGAGPWAGQAKRREELRPLLSTDPVRARVLTQWTEANPPLRVGGATWGFGQAFVRSARRVLEPARLGAIRVPVLIGSPKQEAFTDAALHDVVARAVPTCRVMAFPDAKHCLFLERDAVRGPWLDALADLALTGALPGAPVDATATSAHPAK